LCSTLRRTFCLLIAAIPALAPDAALSADGQEQVRAIIARAIEAHGGAERLGNLPAQTWEESGTYFGTGQSTPYRASIAAHYPRRVKIAVENLYTAAIDGDHAWMTVQGQTRDMRKELLDGRREEQYADWLTTLLPMRDKKFRLVLHDDAIVETRPAAGVRVSWKDNRGMTLYFDKASGLLVKTEQRVHSQEQQGQEVTQEITFLEFEEVQGVKFASKTVTRRNGKQFLETTRTEMKRLEKLDDRLFVRP
jgi:hypothetical protein